MGSIRLGTLMIAALSAVTLAVSAHWSTATIRSHDAEVRQAVRAVRAGLLCAASRMGSLPERLAESELPGVCRLLATSAALALAAESRVLGYRRVAPDRYRICAGFALRPALLDPIGPPVSRVACIEEQVGGGEPVPLPLPKRHQARTRARA
jgi:hypothetical protein